MSLRMAVCCIWGTGELLWSYCWLDNGLSNHVAKNITAIAGEFSLSYTRYLNYCYNTSGFFCCKPCISDTKAKIYLVL